MFSNSVELYDLIYSSFKDYDAEARFLADLIARHRPGAKRILDVGCGTGEHARILSTRHGFEVDGLDIEDGFLELARKKNPGANFFHGDMAWFQLTRRYDVVLSLFSSIGYARTLERVTSTLRCLRRHLEPGGLILVEPWFTPEEWQPGRVDVAGADGTRVARMSHSAAQDRLSILRFEYLVGTRWGIEHRSEIHELGLFTDEEMRACFAEARLDVEHDPVGPMGRGLWLARIHLP